MKGRAHSFGALHMNVASVLLNDLMGDGQSQPCAFVLSAVVFGGKEGVEYAFKIRRRDPAPRILNFDLYPDVAIRFPHLAGFDSKCAAALADCIHGVEK